MAFRVVSRVAGLGALTAAGQLLIIGSLPAYSKIFDPGMYGEYVIFVGAYTVISVLAGVRYDSAIVPCRAATPSRRHCRLWSCSSPSRCPLQLLWRCCSRGRSIGHTCLAGCWIEPGFRLRSCCCNGYRGGAALPHRLVRSQQPVFIDGPWAIRLLPCERDCATLVRKVDGAAAGAYLGICLRTRIPDRVPCDAGLAPAVAWRGRWEFPCAAWVSWRASTADFQLIWWATRLPHRCVTDSCRSSWGSAPAPRSSAASDLPIRVTVFAPNSLVYSAVSPVFFRIASRGSRVQAVGRFAAGLVEATFVVLVVPYCSVRDLKLRH